MVRHRVSRTRQKGREWHLVPLILRCYEGTNENLQSTTARKTQSSAQHRDSIIDRLLDL